MCELFLVFSYIFAVILKWLHQYECSKLKTFFISKIIIEKNSLKISRENSKESTQDSSIDLISLSCRFDLNKLPQEIQNLYLVDQSSPTMNTKRRKE